MRLSSFEDIGNYVGGAFVQSVNANSRGDLRTDKCQALPRSILITHLCAASTYVSVLSLRIVGNI
jgi:hypothetical protein